MFGMMSRQAVEYCATLLYISRFYGRIAKSPSDHEESTLQAIKDNAEGLAGKSDIKLEMSNYQPIATLDFSV